MTQSSSDRSRPSSAVPPASPSTGTGTGTGGEVPAKDPARRTQDLIDMLQLADGGGARTHEDIFVGRTLSAMRRAVYGGQVLAQPLQPVPGQAQRRGALPCAGADDGGRGASGVGE